MKITFLLVLIISLLVGASIAFRYKLNKDLTAPISIRTAIPSPTLSALTTKNKTTLSLFVPYWTLSNKDIYENEFDKIIYFGIKTDEQGISNGVEDKKQLEEFSELGQNKSQRLLALRMIDTQENTRILSDITWQQNIIEQTIEIAKKNGMNGIVIDLELTAIPFEKLVKSITKFMSMFYKESKKNNLHFAITLYGDSFYRPRPFDVKAIAQNSDEIMIMAYDLHKAKGNPGPNFPLRAGERFGYDLTEMIDDFLGTVGTQKLTVIFGLFGYDWLVDEKGQAIEQAQALTLKQIKERFIDKCDFRNCVVTRDKEAGETQIQYTDKDNKNHVVWFEDMESVKQKQEYLKQRGISSFSYWAYSYF